ncbi:MAG: VacJ family lipoprotein [Arenicellaceae bacterium]|nr:VacJ family lipoprotein [Arenicellaceae bacterium]
MKITFTLFCFLFITGCAGVPINKDLDAHRFSGDPEKLNRAVYKFNDRIDKAFLRPIAKGYVTIVPGLARKGIRNVFNNLLEINSLINNILQGDINGAGSNLARFMANTTVGILGLFDVAGKISVDPNVEDFGQTMAVWGIPPGPHIILPFFGSSSLRDALGLIPYYAYTQPQAQFSNFNTRAATTGFYLISQRSDFLGASAILDGQLDPYSFARAAYEQARINAVFDDNPPEEEFDGF